MWAYIKRIYLLKIIHNTYYVVKDKTMKEEVGKRFLECRKSLNLTQKQVANLLGVKQPVYQRFEKGIFECSYSQLLKLSEIFEVSTDYLLGKTEF